MTSKGEIPKITGIHCILRQITSEDVTDLYISWLNDTNVNRYLESRFVKHTIDSTLQYVERMIADTNIIFAAIIAIDDESHIGNIKLGPIDYYHDRGEVGLIIGEKDRWGREYGSEAIKLMTDHAFSKLGLHKLTSGAYEPNKGSIRAFEKAGYHKEAILNKHCFLDGRFVNVVRMAIINSAYKIDDKKV